MESGLFGDVLDDAGGLDGAESMLEVLVGGGGSDRSGYSMCVEANSLERPVILYEQCFTV